MVKKLCALMALLLVLLTSVSLAEGRVTDECGLFSAGQIAKMEQEIEEIRETYQMDCAVLTTRDIPLNSSEDTEDQTRAYADKYYEDHGYGLGEDRAGILYVIDMRNRVSYVSTAGTMIDYIDDNRQEELLSSADEDLYRGRYGNAALALLAKLRDILGRGIEEGHFRYDEATGERLTGIYNKQTGSEMILAAVAAGGVALAVFLLITGRYGLALGTYKFNKATQSSVALTKDEKIFLRSRVSRTRISSGGGGRGGGGGSGGGSGVHFSGGGMSHGGGGHHF